MVSLLFFYIKLGAAFLYVYLHKNILFGEDIFNFYKDGSIIYSALKDNPLHFLELALGRNDYLPEPAYLIKYIDEMGYWYDQSNYFLVRINALFHLFSFGHFSIHVLFFTFLSFTGLIGLYHFFKPYFKNAKEAVLLIILFFIPSIVFWYSGLHKEAPIIFSIGIGLFFLSKLSLKSSIIKKGLYLTGLLFSLYIIYLIRNYIFIAFLSVLFPFLISKKTAYKWPIFIYLTTFSIFLVTGLFLIHQFPELGFYETIIERQQHYFNSVGRTSFDIRPIENNFRSILLNVPQGLLNIIIRPLPTDCIKSNFWCFVAMIESYLLFALLITGIMYLDWKKLLQNNISLFSIFFALFISIVIGIIVNNAGAIVRYKSIAIPFVLIGVYLSIKPFHKNQTQ